jgi:hypothetical protein
MTTPWPKFLSDQMVSANLQTPKTPVAHQGRILRWIMSRRLPWPEQL